MSNYRSKEYSLQEIQVPKSKKDQTTNKAEVRSKVTVIFSQRDKAVEPLCARLCMCVHVCMCDVYSPFEIYVKNYFSVLFT